MISLTLDWTCRVLKFPVKASLRQIQFLRLISLLLQAETRCLRECCFAIDSLDQTNVRDIL